jgi:hypothetical protein
VPLGPCPDGPIVTIIDGGRLANKIWMYAAVWSISLILDRPGYVPYAILESASKIYANLSLRPLEEIEHCDLLDLGEPVKKYDFLPLDKARDKFEDRSVLIEKWALFPEPILRYKDLLHEEFRLLPELKLSVDETVANVGGRGKIKIGVHVRRTDFIPYLATHFSASAVGPYYYKVSKIYFYFSKH